MRRSGSTRRIYHPLARSVIFYAYAVNIVVLSVVAVVRIAVVRVIIVALVVASAVAIYKTVTSLHVWLEIISGFYDKPRSPGEHLRRD